MITCCTAYSVWILVITSNFCITEVRNTTLNSVKSQRQGINRDKFNEDCNGPCSSCLSITIPTKAMGQARNTTPTLALVISGGWGEGEVPKKWRVTVRYAQLTLSSCSIFGLYTVGITLNSVEIRICY